MSAGNYGGGGAANQPGTQGVVVINYTPAATGVLAGSTSLGFSTSGLLKGIAALVGVAALAFSTTGTLRATGALSGSTSLTTTASATPRATGALSGSTSLGFSAIGTLTPPSSAKQIILTSGTSWTVPSDWNNANNKVECIGAGANGNTTSSYGGGGGAYAKGVNLSLTPGSNVVIQIGVPSTNGTTARTYFSLSVVIADGATSNVGGLASGSSGAVTYSGGSGYAGSRSGGGGAAGPNGAGVSSTAVSSAGGSGDAGFGGAGGAYTSSAAGGPGGNGTEWVTAGSGGGGAGAGGTALNGGNGGIYGGGGGGASGGGGIGGTASGGVIVITYTPAPASPIAGSTSLNFAASGTLHGSLALSGTTSLVTTLTGTLTNYAPPGRVTGTTSLTFATHGVLTGTGSLAGNTSLAFVLTGSMIPPSSPLAGSTSLAFTNAGTLTGIGVLSGSTGIAFTLGAPARAPLVYIGVGGAWKQVTPYIGVGGIWQQVNLAWIGAGGAWKSLNAIPMSLSASPSVLTTFGKSTGSLTLTTAPITVSVTGGTGPFTHAWSVVFDPADSFDTSGSGHANSPTSATTTFTGTTVNGRDSPGYDRYIATDTVTDTANGAIAQIIVEVTLFNSYVNPN